MSFFSRIRIAGAALLLFVASAASAAPIRFDFTWSGAQLGNNARATGYIVYERTLVQNPGQNSFAIPSAAVLDLSITVTGAAAGNGTFTRSAFAGNVFETNGATLDFSRQLVGQPTSGQPWGTAPSAGQAGDFNLFIAGGDATDAQGRYASPSRPVPQGGVLPPNGTFYFELTTNGGNGDRMFLTSFAPSGTGTSFVSNVPATNAYGTIALAALLALAGIVAMRRLRAR